jgi:pyroglutamyl-peptidase
MGEEKLTVLVTGFDPFGGEAVNPAFEAAKKLDGVTLAGAEVHTGEIPTIRYQCIAKVREYMDKFHPNIIICVGQAGGSTGISLERVAINCDDFRIPDNGGNQPVDEAIVKDGPAAYFSTLPIRAMKTALLAEGIPAVISNSAGTFVCNHVFYTLMDTLAHDPVKRIGGFIHVPYLPEQTAKMNAPEASMSVDTIVKALRIVIETAVKEWKRSGGVVRE